MDENATNLDVEYKRYLQIMRPYLGQLVDENAIKLCNEWIQRLSTCQENEKSVRNKYIFVLCYQLSKGILEEPFLKLPSPDELAPISEITDSDSSSELEYFVVNENEANTKVIFNNKTTVTSDTECHYKENEFDNADSIKESSSHISSRSEKRSSHATRKQTILCYTCPEMMRACAAEVCGDLSNLDQGNDQYEYRANNLIKRLRDIKKQNLLLHNELLALREESKGKVSDVSLPKVNTSTSAYLKTDSSNTLLSMRNRLKAVEEDKSNLLQTLDSLQDQLDNMEEIKRRTIADLEEKHKTEIAQIKSCLREESKMIYQENIDALKAQYESLIQEFKDASDSQIKVLTIARNDALTAITTMKIEKDNDIMNLKEEKQVKDKEIQELNKNLQEKEKTIQDKDKLIQSKDTEITNLKKLLEEEKSNFNSIIDKFMKNPKDEKVDGDSLILKMQELEKRLAKTEKSKAKCLKIYENKFASLQREKHLTECSLHLQIVRQRAQVINELAEENQNELNGSLDKLEAKYKDIVASVQATALERCAQDEMSMEAIIKAACACGLRNEVVDSYGQISGKTFTARHYRDGSQSLESEVTGPGFVPNNGKNGSNRSYGENSNYEGYCLNGEKIGELIEKMYIPQRDFAMPPNK